MPEEDEPCAIWLPLLHTDQWRTFVDPYYYYILYVNTNNEKKQKMQKAHSSSHLIPLRYQLIFCNDFEKTLEEKQKKKETFFAKILYFTKYFGCFLQHFFGDEFRGLSVAVLWTFLCFTFCGICSVVFFFWFVFFVRFGFLHIMSVLFPLEKYLF